MSIFMNLKHKKISSDILRGKHTLDIGCGQKKLPGAIGLDSRNVPGVDVVADLNRKLPFKNNEFEAVHADQVLEHVDNIIGLVGEVLRILKPGGMFLAHCPYFRSSWAHIDPTHVRSYTINSMDYFVNGTYCYDTYRFGEVFKDIEVFLDTDYESTIARGFFSSRALREPFRYENTIWSNLYPFEQVSYLLTK